MNRKYILSFFYYIMFYIKLLMTYTEIIIKCFFKNSTNMLININCIK